MLKRMTRGKVLSAAAAWAVCGLAWSAFADVPAALDRVPADAVVAVSMKDIAKLHGQFKKLSDATGLPADTGMVEQLLTTPGLNKNGSAAVVLMALPKGGDEGKGEEGPGPMVLVVPVSDYEVFVKSFGGNTTDKVTSLTMPEEMDFEGATEAYAKDLGGGYAAMGPVKDVVTAFDGAGGKSSAHKKAMGPVGTRVADASEAIVVANIEKLGPAIDSGIQGMKDSMGMMLMMAGPQAAGLEAQMRVIESVMNAVKRDASVGIIGVGLGEKGLTFDLAAQFKEGTASHKLFQAKGTASKIMAKLPQQAFLFAGATDLSSPGVKQLAREAAEMNKAQAEDAAPGMFAAMLQTLDKTDGMGFMMGYTPAMLSGGMMANTLTYVETKDGAAYAETIKKLATDMNGKTMQGVTITSSYKPAAQEVAGAKVDEWSVAMQPDPNAEADQMQQQMQMAQKLIWGAEGGPSGYLAVVDGGVVQTLSKNKKLLEKAIASSQGKGTGEADPLLAEVASTLPADRTFEFYIGTKSVLDSVMGLIATFGGGGGNFEVPEKIAPVGFGGTTDSGGVQIRTHVPASVFKAAVGIIKDMEGGGEAVEEPAEENGQPPKF